MRAVRGLGVRRTARWCQCVGVAMGSYDNQVVVLHTKLGMIGLDRCVAAEIQRLWSMGIRTTGHCCGHGVAAPYIGVDARDIPRMKRLGYEVAPNRTRPGDEDSFYPLTVAYPRWRRLWRRACVGLMMLGMRLEDLVA